MASPSVLVRDDFSRLIRSLIASGVGKTRRSRPSHSTHTIQLPTPRLSASTSASKVADSDVYSAHLYRHACLYIYISSGCRSVGAVSNACLPRSFGIPRKTVLTHCHGAVAILKKGWIKIRLLLEPSIINIYIYFALWIRCKFLNRSLAHDS